MIPTKATVTAATTIADLDALFLANNVNCTGIMTGSKRCTDCADCTDCTDCTGCVNCIRCINCTNLSNCTDCVDCDGLSVAVRATNLTRCLRVDKSDDCTDCTDITNSRYCARCYGDPTASAAGNKKTNLWRCADLNQCTRCMHLSGQTQKTLFVGIHEYNSAGFNGRWALTGRS
jgi:hypothetical protein